MIPWFFQRIFQVPCNRRHADTVDQLCLLTLYFEGDHVSEALVLSCDVPAYLTAQYKLHVNPGVNPYRVDEEDGGKTTPLLKVEIQRLEKQAGKGRFWTTAPSLLDDDPNAATLWDWTTPELFWERSVKDEPG